ncbi:MAG: carbohydrate kinase [Clostridia bacterium]|nr:carbohydrate kinase [Clostridia bacterium]
MKILSFGEILWDVFPKERFIGGSPLNFAAHLAVMGEQVYMLSAVGKDGLGKDALNYLKSKNIGLDYVSQSDYPTGQSIITIDDKNTPSYNLLSGVAYDYIPFYNDLPNFDVLYFGTMALRSQHNRETLNKLLEHSFKEIFVDINIRPPYYSADAIDFALKNATVIKISLEELPTVADLTNIAQKDDYGAFAKELQTRYTNLRCILITLGEFGAYALDCANGNGHFCPAVKANAVSAVGAGDSFSAAFVHKYIKNENIDDCLEFAAKIAAFVVENCEAVPDYNIKDFE